MKNSIEIINLTKKYDELVAVNNVSLAIKKGELFSLLGVNGAGKTTIIKILTGIIKQTSGSAILDGYDINNDISAIKKIINVSPQETAIAPNLTVIENLHFIAKVYGVTKEKETIDKLIIDFGLEKILNQKAKKLSGGWQRRLSIAMALINDPEIIFLDEPTLGLDVLARRELWKLITSLKGKKTIILTTHYMEEAESLSDRVAIMVNGNILEIGTSKEIIRKTNTKNLEDAFVKIADGGNI